jgi:uncharacterized low-complexity protein
MATKKTALTLALGSAIAASLAAAPISAAENPFAAQLMNKGYMVAEADKAPDATKAVEAKCGAKKDAAAKAKAKEGKCGGKKKSAKDAAANKKMMQEGKCGEGLCGAKNAKEGKCGAKKAPEAKCGANK